MTIEQAVANARTIDAYVDDIFALMLDGIGDTCPFHGVQGWGEVCPCGFGIDPYEHEHKEADEVHFARYVVDSDHFDRLADRQRVKAKEDRW